MPEAGQSIASAAAGAVSEGSAADILRTAYPDERERACAVEWLIWLAWHMDTSRNLAWWDIPSWVGQRNLLRARALMAAGTLGPLLGLAIGGISPLAVLVAGGVAAVAGAVVSRKVRPGKLRREPMPRAMIPRWPRSGSEFALLAAALLTGLPLRWTLRRLWVRSVTEPPSATPDTSYRACRRSTAIDLAACALAGAPVVLVSPFVGGLLPGLAGLLFAIAFLAALADGKVPAVWQAELFLLIRRRRRIRFHRFLERAADRRVLCPVGPYYRFRDPSVQDHLTGIHLAALDERARRRAAKKQQIETAVMNAKGGIRARLLRLLSPNAIFRLAVDLGCAVGIGIYAGTVANRPPGDNAVWRTAVLSGLFGPAVVFPAAFVVLTVVVGGTRWSLWRTARMSSRTRVAVPAALACVAGLIVGLLGPAMVGHGIAVTAVALMPAVLVAAVGGWACVLVHRRWQASRHWPVRHAADPLLMAVTGTAILLLFHRDLVSAQAAAGLLFPVAAWLSIRGWRALNGAGRFALRAAADIAVSLMLGGCLVLLLVWLANLLHMPAAEVAVLRAVLRSAGAALDLPWWTWAALYLVLAGVSLASAVWPAKLATVVGWFTRLRVVPSAQVTRRVLTAVHVGLLVAVLIGLAAPAATAPALRARLAARYTETLADTLRARGELAAYQAIAREASQARPALLAPLADLVAQIDAIGAPSPGQHDATGTELDLAQRIGELQAVTLARRPPGVAQAEAAVTRQDLFSSPASAGEEDKSLGELDAAEQKGEASEKLVDQAAELAATAVAQVLQVPGLGHTEVVQVISEYLSGLIENSPLRDVFAAWAGRITGWSQPPPAAELVIPDPGRLKDVAVTALTGELAKTPVTDRAAAERLLGETGIVAAVDIANQIRYLQEDSGPCDGCAQPVHPLDQPDRPVIEQPEPEIGD
jgi:hypothetical protein